MCVGANERNKWTLKKYVLPIKLHRVSGSMDGVFLHAVEFKSTKWPENTTQHTLHYISDVFTACASKFK